MSISTTVTYDTPVDFTFDAAKVVVGSLAALLLQSASAVFNEDFADDTGFTYDSSVTEFSGGQVQQKSQRPTDATFGATYTSSIDGSWGDGVLTGTAVGGASVSGGFLDLLGGATQYVDYPGLANASTATQQLSVRFKIKPGYTGKPGQWKSFWSIAKADSDLVNRLELRHSSSQGQLQYRMNGSNGVGLGTFTMANWLPTAGQEYEFLCVFDFDAGDVYLFIDGVLFDSSTGHTGTRDSNIGLLRVGNDYNANENANQEIADFVVYDSVFTTTNYTPGYTLAERDYLADDIDLPQFTHTGLGSIISLDSMTTTEAGAPRYNLKVGAGNYKYWTGSAWADSDGTYAQSSTQADISANLGTFPSVSGNTTVDVRLVTTDSNTQASVADLNLNHTANSGYATDDPSIVPNSGVEADGLTAFSSVESASGSDSIGWIACLNNVAYYFDGSAWVTSDGTLAQSNTAADINTNAASLDISNGVTLKFKALLHSDDGTTTPTVTSHSYTYSFFVAEPTLPNRCKVYGWVNDPDDGTPVEGARVVVTCDPFEHGGRFIFRKQVQVLTNEDGYFELSLIETGSVSLTPYTVQITGDRLPARARATYTNVSVPDQLSATLASLVS